VRGDGWRGRVVVKGEGSFRSRSVVGFGNGCNRQVRALQ